MLFGWLYILYYTYIQTLSYPCKQSGEIFCILHYPYFAQVSKINLSLTSYMADSSGKYASCSVQTHPETSHGQKKLSRLLFSSRRLLASQSSEKVHIFLPTLLKFFGLQGFSQTHTKQRILDKPHTGACFLHKHSYS